MKLPALGTLLALLALETPAVAQGASPAEPPSAAKPWTAPDAWLIVGAERLFGLHVYSMSFEHEGTTSEFRGTMVSAFQGQSAINNEDDVVNPYAIPRIGADAALGKGFTIGGGLGFAITSGTDDRGDTEQDLVGASSFAVQARFGYLISAGESLAIWLRGGPEYFSSNRDDTDDGRKVTSFDFAFTLDPQLVFTPMPHAAILLGPLIGVGIWGKSETSDELASFETTTRRSSFGVTSGLALLF